MKIELRVNDNFYKTITNEAYIDCYSEYIFSAREIWESHSGGCEVIEFRFNYRYNNDGCRILDCYNDDIVIRKWGLERIEKKKEVIILPAKEKDIPVVSRFDILDL